MRLGITTKLAPLLTLSIEKNNGKVCFIGDGINDAPAIKHADVGIAMGINGSEITKETADIVLLDDSFYTIIKAISFGRNVYRNLQRFILFQLSVNLSALLFITFTAIFGYDSPFNTLQLLWINVIMDGPPALTLGLENSTSILMNNKPINRNKSIVTKKMFFRIIFNGVFISSIIILQFLTNFLGVIDEEQNSAIFTLFILFHLFNAFNSREIGSDSIFSLPKNKIMSITFLFVFFVQIFITQVLYRLFNISPLSLISWVKIILLSLSIIVISELFKMIVRIVKRKNKKTNNNYIGA